MKELQFSENFNRSNVMHILSLLTNKTSITFRICGTGYIVYTSTITDKVYLKAFIPFSTDIMTFDVATNTYTFSNETGRLFGELIKKHFDIVTVQQEVLLSYK